MQASTKTTITNPTLDPHSLKDIRALFVIEKTAEVNRRGEAISPPSVISENIASHGWVCLRCQISFLQWSVGLAHLRDMQEIERNKLVPGQATDLIRFAHEVLGVTITQQQAMVVVDIINSPPEQRLEVSGRKWGQTEAMRIARAYQEIKG